MEVQSFLYLTNMDPKYLNIPNIQFSLTNPEDQREPDFSKQRIERGFDDSETWSLDTTISSFIIPRLKRFNEVKICHPMSMSMSEWTSIIDKMLLGFELNVRDSNSTLTHSETEMMMEGLDLFRKHFFDLWW